MYSVIVLMVFCSCFHKYFIKCDNFYPLDNSRNCDVEQQNMNEIYKYHRFYPMFKMHNLKPAGYYAKISFYVNSDIGSEAHIILSESNELHNKNRCYEFVFGGTNIFAGVRRKDSIHEMCHFVTDALALYKTRDATTEVETSVSVDGVVQLTFLHSKFPVFLRDDGGPLQVNYIYIDTNNTRLTHVSMEDDEQQKVNTSYSKVENENSQRKTIDKMEDDEQQKVNSSYSKVDNENNEHETIGKEVISNSQDRNKPFIVNMLIVSAWLLIIESAMCKYMME